MVEAVCHAACQVRHEVRILLDTSALIWWMEDEPMLGRRARALLADPDNQIVASIVSLWEITMKWRAGKYPSPGSSYAEPLREEQVELIEVSITHLDAVEQLDWHHRDPFDHLIIAQAKVEEAAILTSDRDMTLYGVRCFPAGR